jgi:DNA-directed RNA polymerase subunit RPC12/RpoP
MRVVTSNIEYLIKCPCGLRLAYEFPEANNQYARCPHCGLQHLLNGSHPMIVSEECTVHYNSLRIDSGEISKEEIQQMIEAQQYSTTEEILNNL